MGRVLAGGYEIDEPCWNDGKVSRNPSRENADPEEIARLMAANNFYCQRFCAIISRQQCVANQAKGLYLCGLCEEHEPQAPTASPGRRCGRPKRYETKSPWNDNPGMLRISRNRRG